MRPRLSTMIRTPTQLGLILALNFTFVGSVLISGFLPILRLPKIFPGMVGEGVPLCILGPVSRALTGWWPIIFLLVFMAVFLLVVLAFGRGLCGWACPIGFFQDVMSWIRSALRISPKEPSVRVHRNLNALKFAILALLILMAISVGASHLADSIAGDEFRQSQPGMMQSSPACAYCIAPSMRAVYDLFVYQSYNLSDPIFLLQFSVVGIFFAWAFVTPRAWCRYLCPAGAMSALFIGVSMLYLNKEQDKCTRCNICTDVCPTRSEAVCKEAKKDRVSDSACIFCMKCVDACPEDCLHINIGQKKIYSGGKQWSKKRRKNPSKGVSRNK